MPPLTRQERERGDSGQMLAFTALAPLPAGHCTTGHTGHNTTRVTSRGERGGGRGTEEGGRKGGGKGKGEEGWMESERDVWNDTEDRREIRK